VGSAALTNVKATDLMTFQSVLRANDELPVRGPRVMESVRDHQGRLHDELPAAAAGLKHLTLESPNASLGATTGMRARLRAWLKPLYGLE
jgi:hypothetical protein